MNEYQPRFQTLNRQHFSEQRASAESSSFHLFQQLPAEIRLRVWKYTLQKRRRLFTFRLSEGSAAPGSYSITAEQPPGISPLLRTCCESRQAAHEYFRLPILLDNSKTLWIAPESDHLFLRRFDIRPSAFVNFMNDMKASDPRRIGLLHIAFEGLCSKTVSLLKALASDDDIPDDAFDCFKTCVTNLRSLWFIHLLPIESRIGFGDLPPGRNHAILGYNRGLPIFPHAVEFELLASDPRPIQASLRKQTVWKDPKCPVEAWMTMEEKLGFNSEKLKDDKNRVREISHILAMGGRRGYYSPGEWDLLRHSEVINVRCARTMDDCLKLELDILKRSFISGQFKKWKHIYYKEVERGKEYLLSAAGFWIFPLGTFETVHKYENGTVYKDLSGLQPGIGIFDLQSHPGTSHRRVTADNSLTN